MQTEEGGGRRREEGDGGLEGVGTICSKRNEARNGATENQIDDCIQFLPCFIFNVLFLTMYRLYKGERQNTDSFLTNKHFFPELVA